MPTLKQVYDWNSIDSVMSSLQHFNQTNYNNTAKVRLHLFTKQSKLSKYCRMDIVLNQTTY